MFGLQYAEDCARFFLLENVHFNGSRRIPRVPSSANTLADWVWANMAASRKVLIIGTVDHFSLQHDLIAQIRNLH